MKSWNDAVKNIKSRMPEKVSGNMEAYIVDNEEDNFEYICENYSNFTISPDEAILKYEENNSTDDNDGEKLHLFKITIEKIESYFVKNENN